MKLEQAIRSRLNGEAELAWHSYLKASQDKLSEKEKGLFVCLESSLARWKGETNYPRIKELKDLAEGLDFKVAFYAQLDLGSWEYSRGNFDIGLAYYLKAIESAPRLDLKLIATINAIMAADAASIPRNQLWMEAKNLRSKLKEVLPIVDTQLTYLNMENAWLMGDFENQLDRSLQANSQACYLKRWINEIPYIKGKNKLEDDTKLLKIYNGPFRVRTLSERITPEDLINNHLHDVITRVYLWLWKWIDSPEVYRLENLSYFISNCSAWNCKPATAYQEALKKNIYLWMSFFKQDQEHTPLSESSSGNYPVLTLERLYINYLAAKKLNDSILVQNLLRQIYEHSLFHSPYLKFKEWIESGRHLNSDDPKNAGARFKIDESSMTITDNKTQKKTTSETLMKTLLVLAGHKVYDAQKLYREVFGGGEFDSYVHTPKLRQLFNRISKLTSRDFSASIRSQTIIVDAEWSSFHFIKQDIYSKQITLLVTSDPLTPSNNSLFFEKGFVDKAQVAKSLIDLGEFERKDLEIQLKISRSSAGRAISKMLSTKIVEKVGSTKGSRYRFINSNLSPKVLRGVL